MTALSKYDHLLDCSCLLRFFFSVATSLSAWNTMETLYSVIRCLEKVQRDKKSNEAVQH